MTASGIIHRIYIEDDFDDLADYEIKWVEREATPEFQTWKKWFEIVIGGSYEVNFRDVIVYSVVEHHPAGVLRRERFPSATSPRNRLPALPRSPVMSRAM